MCRFRVRQPGAFSTVQDAGRYGFQQYGLPISGAMDHFSYRVANLLVGNPLNAAALEMTVLGPTLEVLESGLAAVAGADLLPTLNRKPTPLWTSFYVQAGDVLAFRGLRSGCRAYLAVAGGIQVPEILGSCSTFVDGKIGGLHGRPLRSGDILSSGDVTDLPQITSLARAYIPTYGKTFILRCIGGPQEDYFSPQTLRRFYETPYLVTERADRRGLRLDGPRLHVRKGFPRSIISEPNIPGGVQITPDGHPIVILREQTTGGYPKIAAIISVDLSLVGQAKTGDTFHFQQVSLEEAHSILRSEEQRWENLVSRMSGGT
jgi:antagonist of KipI